MFVQNRDHSTVTGKLTKKSSKSDFGEYSCQNTSYSKSMHSKMSPLQILAQKSPNFLVKFNKSHNCFVREK